MVGVRADGKPCGECARRGRDCGRHRNRSQEKTSAQQASKLLVQPAGYEFARSWANNGLPWPRPTVEVFYDQVDDYMETPWINVGVHVDLTDQFWATVEPMKIDPSELCATQKKLLKKPFHTTLDNGVNRAGEDTKGESRSLPWVVFWRDRPWVVDGHHRAAVAVLENEPLLVRAVYL